MINLLPLSLLSLLILSLLLLLLLLLLSLLLLTLLLSLLSSIFFFGKYKSFRGMGLFDMYISCELLQVYS